MGKKDMTVNPNRMITWFNLQTLGSLIYEPRQITIGISYVTYTFLYSHLGQKFVSLFLNSMGEKDMTANPNRMITWFTLQTLVSFI